MLGLPGWGGGGRDEGETAAGARLARRVAVTWLIDTAPFGPRSCFGRDKCSSVSNFPDLTRLWSIIYQEGRNSTESFSTVPVPGSTHNLLSVSEIRTRTPPSSDTSPSSPRSIVHSPLSKARHSNCQNTETPTQRHLYIHESLPFSGLSPLRQPQALPDPHQRLRLPEVLCIVSHPLGRVFPSGRVHSSPDEQFTTISDRVFNRQIARPLQGNIGTHSTTFPE